MKKFFAILFFCIGILFSIGVKADVIMPNTHAVTRCITIENPDEFSSKVLIGYTKTVQGDNEFSLIKSNTCLTKGYKFNQFFILLVERDYLDRVGINKIDSENSDVINLGSYEPWGGYIDDKNPLVKEDIVYFLTKNCDEYKLYMQEKISYYNNGDSKDIKQFPSSPPLCDNEDYDQYFYDVSEDHEYFQAINYMKDHSIIKGYEDGSYKPEKSISRGEFLKIIIESSASKEDIESCIEDNTQANWNYVYFPDVKKTDWFAKYICVAKNQGIVGGYPDGKFRPYNTIKFSEAAKIIVNTFEYSVYSDKIWYKPYIETLADKYAIPSSIYSFTQQINRGETAEIIRRLEEHINDKPYKTYEDLH